MKKAIGALALVLVVFSTLYLSTDAFASKAALKIAPQTEVVDVSDLDVANFQVVDMSGFSSVSILARDANSFNAFTVVGSFSNITSAATYQVSASDLQSQYGHVTLEWKIKDNSSSSESSLCTKTIQP